MFLFISLNEYGPCRDHHLLLLLLAPVCVFLVSLWISFHFPEQLSCCPEGLQVLCSALEPVTQVLLRNCTASSSVLPEARAVWLLWHLCCSQAAVSFLTGVVFSVPLWVTVWKKSSQTAVSWRPLSTGNLARDKPVPRLHPTRWLRTGA